MMQKTGGGRGAKGAEKMQDLLPALSIRPPFSPMHGNIFDGGSATGSIGLRRNVVCQYLHMGRRPRRLGSDQQPHGTFGVRW